MRDVIEIVPIEIANALYSDGIAARIQEARKQLAEAIEEAKSKVAQSPLSPIVLAHYQKTRKGNASFQVTEFGDLQFVLQKPEPVKVTPAPPQSDTPPAKRGRKKREVLSDLIAKQIFVQESVGSMPPVPYVVRTEDRVEVSESLHDFVTPTVPLAETQTEDDLYNKEEREAIQAESSVAGSDITFDDGDFQETIAPLPEDTDPLAIIDDIMSGIESSEPVEPVKPEPVKPKIVSTAPQVSKKKAEVLVDDGLDEFFNSLESTSSEVVRSESDSGDVDYQDIAQSAEKFTKVMDTVRKEEERNKDWQHRLEKFRDAVVKHFPDQKLFADSLAEDEQEVAAEKANIITWYHAVMPLPEHHKMLESLGLSWRVYEAIEEEYADLSKPMNMKMTDKHSARNYVNRDYNALRVSMREAFLRGMARLKTTAEDRNRSCEAAWKDLDVPKFYFVSATEIYVGKEEIEAYKQKMGASFVEKPVKSTIVRKRISHSFMNSMIEKLKEEDYIRKTLVDNDPTLASEVESGTGLDYEPVNTEDPDDVPVNTEDPEEANLENMEDPEESQSDNIEEQEEVYLDEI